MAIYQLSWNAPTTRTDGSALPAGEIAGYIVRRVFGGNTTEYPVEQTVYLLDIGSDAGVGTLTVAAVDFVGAMSTFVAVPNVVLYNNPPVLSVKLTSISVRIATTDADADTVIATIQAQGTKGVATVTGSTNGEVRYTPNDGQTGTDTFTVKLSDGRTGGDITQDVTVDITNWRVTSGSLDIRVARAFA